jgi:PAS domain S-box-containing protein
MNREAKRSPVKKKKSVVKASHTTPSADLITSNLLEELTSSTKHYRALLQCVSLGIIETDAKLKVSYANPAATHMLMKGEEEILGREAAILVPGRERASIREMLDTLALNTKPFSTEKTVCCRGKRLKISAANLVEGGALFGFMILIQDVTKLSREIEEEARIAILGDLAASITHGINTPLTSILGFTCLLLEKLGTTSPLRHDLLIVRQEAERARNTIRGLFHLIKPLRL